jgi:hypothetical protein
MEDSKILMMGVLFFIVGNPMTYDLVDKYIPVTDSNGPTQLGVVFHAIVFCILLSLLSKYKLTNKLL